VKKTPTQLVEEHRSLIESEVSKHTLKLPIVVVRAEAYKIANEAAKSFDEKKGVKFSTYLVNQLKQLSRLGTQFGNVVRLPEETQFQKQKVQEAKRALREELAREPSAQEIADRTFLPLQVVNKVLMGLKTEVNLGSLTYDPVIADRKNDNWVRFVYHDLPEIDQKIFEYKTGFGGAPVLGVKEIAKKLDLSPTHVGKRIDFISDRLAMGMD
jgi:DNA-directed RNA polymerase specialized sigma subunit